MASEYTIIGHNMHKFTVQAIDAEITGLYDSRDGTITRPCTVDISQLIPWRYRRAFNRTNGRFWYNEAARIGLDGVTTEQLPYLPLYDARGKHMTTLYAIAR